MPNWCQNILTVRGNKEEVEGLVEFVKNENGEVKDQRMFDFNTIKPYPEIFDEQGAGGNEWCIENWGTKKIAFGVKLEHKLNVAVYSFFTAWSPPLPVIHEAGVKFPHLEFTNSFIEYGEGFMGKYKMRNGKEVELKCEEIPAEMFEESKKTEEERISNMAKLMKNRKEKIMKEKNKENKEEKKDDMFVFMANK